MNDLDDQHLDALLSEHFGQRLEPQRGKAARAFVATRGGAMWKRALGLALAACIAGLLILPSLVHSGKPAAPKPAGLGQTSSITPQAPVETVSLTPVSHEIEWQTVDQGTVFYNGDQPMRSIRRQQVDSVRWIDPDTKAQMELQVPHDEVVLVGLHAN